MRSMSIIKKLSAIILMCIGIPAFSQGSRILFLSVTPIDMKYFSSGRIIYGVIPFVISIFIFIIAAIFYAKSSTSIRLENAIYSFIFIGSIIGMVFSFFIV